MFEEEPLMDQDVARKLLVKGATLIILNLPRETEFGIDMKSWHTGNKFKGVKMIPPGLHMYYYNVTTKYGDIAPRVSFIHNFKKEEIVVKKWNADTEEIISDDPSEEELSRLKSNLHHLDQFLGPYPYNIWETWKSLIANISEKLVQRVTPECGIIRSALDLVTAGETNTRSNVSEMAGSSTQPSSTVNNETENDDSCAQNQNSDNVGLSASTSSGVIGRRIRKRDREASFLPHLKPTPGTELRFTSVPDDMFPKNSTPEDITRHSIDPTYTLETLLSSMDDEKEYIGEVELSFVCFLVGQSLDALDAWKALVTLPCRCENFILKRPKFYALLLTSLNSQLQHIPEDFLVDIVESENAIYTSLRDVFRSTQTTEGVPPSLKKQSFAFSQQLYNRFGWDFSNLDEDDEDEAPVIVEL